MLITETLSKLFIHVFENSYQIIFILLSSLLFRIILEIFKQRWIKTIAQTSTLFLLPIITFIITKVIAGNIALSLGMVGALSIVRFRNPVRSPLELSVYFAAITLGISTSVSLSYSFLLVFLILCCSISLYLVSLISKKFFNKSFFLASFSEGNTLSTLEVQSTKNIKYLDENILLKSKSFFKDEFNYLIASENFNNLKLLAGRIEKDQNVIKYQLNE